MTQTLSQLVETYIDLLRQIDAAEARHKEELQPLKEVRDEIERETIQSMVDERCSSHKLDNGALVFLTEFTSLKTVDFGKLLAFAVENDKQELLATSANRTAVAQLVEAGVSYADLGLEAKRFKKLGHRKGKMK